MKELRDTVWQRRGISWLWDNTARDHVCKAHEVGSLRQFLQATLYGEEYPKATGCSLERSLEHSLGRAFVVGGLDTSLDLLTPEEAKTWLREEIKKAIKAFQQRWAEGAALIFWLPRGDSRFDISSTDVLTWRCRPSGDKIDFGRILWGQRDYPQHIMQGDKKIGFFYPRLS